VDAAVRRDDDMMAAQPKGCRSASAIKNYVFLIR
jgi:hypothetical protein